jgi:hypothetical protein
MKRLSYAEEVSILKGLLEDDVEAIGCGSSRLVFPYGKDKVIKLAVTEEGIAQNQTEIDCFEDAPENTVAEIFSYGYLIIVAERLTDILNDNDEMDYSDIEEYIRNNCEDKEQADGFVNAFEKALDFLDSRFDETDDNLQIGKNSKGFYVAYDYGFSRRVDHAHEHYVSCMCDLSYDGDPFVLKLALNLINVVAAVGAPNNSEIHHFFLGYEDGKDTLVDITSEVLKSFAETYGRRQSGEITIHDENNLWGYNDDGDWESRNSTDETLSCTDCTETTCSHPYQPNVDSNE